MALLQYSLLDILGAEVTGVDSKDKLDMLSSIGAKRVIDYAKEDYTQSGETYDLIIDVVGRGYVPRRLRLLKEGGYYFLAYAGFSIFFSAYGLH